MQPHQILTAKTKTTIKFDNWTIDGTEISTNNEIVFFLYSNTILSANFARKYSGSYSDDDSNTTTTNTRKWIQVGSDWWYQYRNSSYPKNELCRINNP